MPAPFCSGSRLRLLLQSWEGTEIDVDDIGLSRPSLDDVFLSLTGHRTEVEVEA